MNKKILIVAAHPDDEVLGCGGTVARLVKKGYEAHTLILGEGITSRQEGRNSGARAVDLRKLKQESLAANRILGVKSVFAYDFPDNKFDTVPLLDLVRVIEKIKKQIKPGIIFTHFKEDLNIDHRITYNAVITACRPQADESVKEVYSFEILSSTEWNYPLSFSPDAFFDISNSLGPKVKAMQKYKSELRKFPHPRSIEGIKLNAAYLGMRVGLKYAEAFKIVRAVK
jgi:LmbE family N-acetylglucosaminyl deacetylase